MQNTVDYEQTILTNLRQLSVAQQQEVLDFTEFLRQKFAISSPESNLSLQQIVKLSVRDRHQYLKDFIATTANDFLTDSTLTEFSVLDVEDWDISND